MSFNYLKKLQQDRCYRGYVYNEYKNIKETTQSNEIAPHSLRGGLCMIAESSRSKVQRPTSQTFHLIAYLFISQIV